jgi:uncharacterized protein (TIGR02246 family)
MRPLLLVLIAFAAVSPSAAVAQSSADEVAAIKKVIDNTVQAVKKDDLNLLLAQFADDALIDSRAAGGKVSKDKYREAMAAAFKQGNIVNVEMRDLDVRIVDSTRATALGTSFLTTKTDRLSGRTEWKFEKRDGRWLIVETNRK